MMIVDIFDIIQQVRDTLYCAMALLSYIITFLSSSYLIMYRYYFVFGWFWLWYVLQCFCVLKFFWCPYMAINV